MLLRLFNHWYDYSCYMANNIELDQKASHLGLDFSPNILGSISLFHTLYAAQYAELKIASLVL